MTADFSRNSFRSKDGFSAVRLQQGRVQMDADWNEQVDIVNTLVRQTTADLIGTAGAPIPGGGFALMAHNSLVFHGNGWAQTAPTQTFNIGGRRTFAIHGTVCGVDGQASGTILALIDSLGRPRVTLSIDEDGCLVGRRGESTVLRSTTLSWEEPFPFSMVYDGNKLSLQIQGERVAEETDTADLDCTEVNEPATNEAKSDGPVIEGEKTEKPPSVQETQGAESVEMALYFRLGAGAIDGEPGQFYTGKADALTLVIDDQIVGDWGLDEGYGSVILDASRGQHSLEISSTDESGLEWELNSIHIGEGRFYLDGVLCQARSNTALGNQPLAPDVTIPERDGTYVAYLDVRERTVTAIDDPQLREVALGGADTSVRSQIIPSVRLLRVDSDPGAPLEGSVVHQNDQWRIFRNRFDANGTMAAQRSSRLFNDALENRLYRVEVHRGGIPADAPHDGRLVAASIIDESTVAMGFEDPIFVPGQWIRIQSGGHQHVAVIRSLTEDGAQFSPPIEDWKNGPATIEAVASFVWSDNNAAQRFVVDEFGEDEIVLHPFAQVGTTRIRKGDLIAVADEQQRLSPETHVLREVVRVSRDGRTLQIDPPLPERLVESPKGVKSVQLWRAPLDGTVQTRPLTNEWVELEHGIEVRFSGQRFRDGQTWTIPARAQTRAIEWPSVGGDPCFQQADEGIRSLCPLAIVRVKEGGLSVEDCRPTFKTLAHSPDSSDEDLLVQEIDQLAVQGDAEVRGTLDAGLIRGHLASGMVDTQHIRDRSVDANKIGSGAVGLRQLHGEVGLVPSGFSILGESPHPPSGFVYAHQQVPATNHRPVWRNRPPLAGADVGRVQCVMAGGALFAILENGQLWRSEGGSGPWHVDAEMRPIRRDFAVAAVNDKIHILGGMTEKGKAIADHDIFDVDTRTWEKGPKLPVPSAGHAAACVDGVLFVLGGMRGWFLGSTVRDFIDPVTPDFFLRASRTTRAVYALPMNGTKWLRSHNMPTSRSYHCAEVLNGRVHVVGGHRRYPLGTAEPLSAHESYLVNAGRWEHRTPLALALAHSGATAVAGQLHIIGGQGWDGPSAQHFAYTPRTDSWEPSVPMDDTRCDPGVTECFGEVYVLGGWASDGPTSAAISCNVSKVLYVHQKSDDLINRAHDGTEVTGGSPSTPGGQADPSGLASMAALAASTAAVSAATLAMDPEHASKGTRGPPAIPAASNNTASLHTPSAIKKGGSFLMILAILAVIGLLLFWGLRAGVANLPRAQAIIQQHLPAIAAPLSSVLVPNAAPSEAPPDLSRCANAAGAPTMINLGASDPALAQGVDVSHHNGPVPWKSLQQGGIAFAYAKASEGAHFKDQTFLQNWQGMKDCGILRGAYHFYKPAYDPFKQAHNFLAALQGNPGDLPAVIDIEKGMLGERKDCKKLLPHLVHFAATVHKGTGMAPIVYASRSFWNEHFTCADSPEGAAAISALSQYPLWVAKYDTGPPQMFGGWTEYAFWQYTDQGAIGTGTLDLNHFNGDLPTLKAWLKAFKQDPTTTPSQVRAQLQANTATTAAPVESPATTAPATAPATTPTVPTTPNLPNMPSTPPSTPSQGG